VIVIATAGWSLPRACQPRFDAHGTHLQRYARVLRGTEINSSFYRGHAVSTYAHWARQTPRNFRFSVKLPREITHEGRLRAARRPLLAFLASLQGLGARLGPLIVQLPPSLAYERRSARTFFSLLREHHAGPVACEPRHPGWFADHADALLAEHGIARVAADPAVVEAAAMPGGDTRLVYYRLHGSPRMYWSDYEAARLAHWAAALRALPRRIQAWCVFDNTASSAAMKNALELRTLLAGPGSLSSPRPAAPARPARRRSSPPPRAPAASAACAPPPRRAARPARC
jgi:uncharacterized protein YecE (DUF72 family)